MSRVSVVALLFLSPVALAGSPNAGGMPQCKADLAECESDLGACEGDVTALMDELDRVIAECDDPTIRAATGGVATSADGRALVSVPPGALAKDTVLTVKKVTPTVDVARASDVYDFGPNGTTFSTPATVCLAIDGAKPEDTCLGFLDEKDGKWKCEDECVRAVDRQVCGVTDHFTSFALLLGGGGGGECDAGANTFITGGKASYTGSSISITGGTFQTFDSVDVDFDASSLNIGGGSVTFGGTSTIDMAGSTLSVSGGDLTLSGSSKAAFPVTNGTITGGSLFVADNASLTLDGGSTFTIDGGNLELRGQPSFWSSSSEIFVKGGSLKMGGSSGFSGKSTPVTVTGGSFILTDNAFIDLTDDSALTVNGGNLQLTGNASLGIVDSGISVSGGSFELSGSASFRVIRGEEGARTRSVRAAGRSMLTVGPSTGTDVKIAGPDAAVSLTDAATMTSDRGAFAIGAKDTVTYGALTLDAAGMAKLLEGCPRTLRFRAADSSVTCSVAGAEDNPKCANPGDTAPATSECEVVVE